MVPGRRLQFLSLAKTRSLMDAMFSAHIFGPMCQKHLLTPVSSFMKWKDYFQNNEPDGDLKSFHNTCYCS